MGPTTKQDQSLVVNDQAGAGFRTGIGSCGERSLPSPGGQVELPQVIEGGAGAGAAAVQWVTLVEPAGPQSTICIFLDGTLSPSELQSWH